MREIRTSIEIDTEPSAVWGILMDFDAYSEWNPFIRSIEGAAVEGARIDVQLGASGKKPMSFKPVVQETEAPRRFSWLGSVMTKGVFDGKHQFELEATDSGTRFHHYEEFSGFLAPLMLAAIGKTTKRGFEEMNAALKTRAESSA
jgi:hypothetical protein